MGENLGKPWKPSKALFPAWLRKIRKNQEGGGTSVHRLLRTYVSVIDAFTIFIYSICAQAKNIEDSVCKNARRMEEERKTRSTAGGPFILPCRGGSERGCMYYQPWCSGPLLLIITCIPQPRPSDSGHALLFAIKIIIALQIGQESVKGKNKLDQLTQKTSTDKKTVLKETERQNQQTNENDLRRIVRNRSDTLNTRVAPKNNLFGYVPPERCRDFKIPASQFSHY